MSSAERKKRWRGSCFAAGAGCGSSSSNSNETRFTANLTAGGVMRTFAWFLALLAVLSAGTMSQSQAAGQSVPATPTSSTERRNLDKAVFQTMREAMDEAATLYNS